MKLAPQPGPHEAFLWWTRPEPAPPAEAAPQAVASPRSGAAAELALLSSGEREVWQRALSADYRSQYLATRVLARRALGHALGAPPESLAFTRTPAGRPELAPPSPLRFNLSNTEGLVVCLLSAHHEVGVDVERESRGAKLLQLAPTVFSAAEQRDLQALAPKLRERRAVVLWALKEAYLKARGKGLSLPLDRFSFGFDGSGDVPARFEVDASLLDDAGRWQFHTLLLGDHRISAAIACPPSDPVALRLRELVRQV